MARKDQRLVEPLDERRLPDHSGVVTMGAYLIVVLTLMCTEPAIGAEVFKCVDNGTTVFQGTPCAGSGNKVTVKPANGTIAADTPADSTPASPAATTTGKLKASVSTMELDRKKREIDYDIRDLEGEVDRNQRAMEHELAALERKKSRANNNLAGATWEQSISTEMQAVTEKYSTRIRVVQDRIASLRRQSDDLAKRQQEQAAK